MNLGDLDKRIRIERPVHDDAADSAGAESWALVATPWAQIQDVLPSRAPTQSSDGINVSKRPARVRMLYRTDITPDMRLVHGARIMAIVAGPATVGNNDWTEFMVEQYSSAGNRA